MNIINRGWAKPDDPIYKSGLSVSFRPQLTESTETLGQETNSTISQSLLDSYTSAEYHVHTQPPFILKIGVPSNELAQLYEANNCKCAAFITAYNPYSQELTRDVNKLRNQKLEALIQSKCFKYFQGVGKCASDDGEGEVSFLILGIDKDTASDLGKQFEQNAIVWCSADADPQLILLK